MDSPEAVPAPEPSKDSIGNVSEIMEKALGAPPGSITGLVRNDDWSFIIKAHALIEGAISMLLAGVLDGRLRPIFNRLELGAAETGKLEFSKALRLTTSNERRFIGKLSTLRNLVADDMKHLGFSLEAYIAGLDKQQRKSFYESLLLDIVPEKHAEWLEFMAKQPKWAIYGGVPSVISKALMTLHEAAYKALRDNSKSSMRRRWTSSGSIRKSSS